MNDFTKPLIANPFSKITSQYGYGSKKYYDMIGYKPLDFSNENDWSDILNPITAAQMLNEQNYAFNAMPDTQIYAGSLGNIGKSVGDWWNNTPWTGPGGKFSTVFDWGGKATKFAGDLAAYGNMRTNRKAIEGAIINMELSRQGSLAQLHEGKRKALAKEKLLTDPGISAKEAYAYASTEADKYMADKFNWKA